MVRSIDIIWKNKVNGTCFRKPHTLPYHQIQLLEFWELCEHAQCTRYMILRYIPYFYCFSEHFAFIPF